MLYGLERFLFRVGTGNKTNVRVAEAERVNSLLPPIYYYRYNLVIWFSQEYVSVVPLKRSLNRRVFFTITLNYS